MNENSVVSLRQKDEIDDPLTEILRTGARRLITRAVEQPDAREGQAGRVGVAERPVIPMKPGNAGGGKEPQFKTDARRGEGPGDWAT